MPTSTKGAAQSPLTHDNVCSMPSFTVPSAQLPALQPAAPSRALLMAIPSIRQTHGPAADAIYCTCEQHYQL